MPDERRKRVEARINREIVRIEAETWFALQEKKLPREEGGTILSSYAEI
jgi:hypothetical protein